MTYFQEMINTSAGCSFKMTAMGSPATILVHARTIYKVTDATVLTDSSLTMNSTVSVSVYFEKSIPHGCSGDGDGGGGSSVP